MEPMSSLCYTASLLAMVVGANNIYLINLSGNVLISSSFSKYTFVRYKILVDGCFFF